MRVQNSAAVVACVGAPGGGPWGVGGIFISALCFLSWFEVCLAVSGDDVWGGGLRCGFCGSLFVEGEILFGRCRVCAWVGDLGGGCKGVSSYMWSGSVLGSVCVGYSVWRSEGEVGMSEFSSSGPHCCGGGGDSDGVWGFGGLREWLAFLLSRLGEGVFIVDICGLLLDGGLELCGFGAWVGWVDGSSVRLLG